VLAAALEDGSLGLFDTAHSMDVRPRRTRMLRYQALLHCPPAPAGSPEHQAQQGQQPWGLLAAPPLGAPPLLPRAWGLLLRLLLQRGLPDSAFRELGALAAAVSGSSGSSATGGSGRSIEAERALERLEVEVGEMWRRKGAGGCWSGVFSTSRSSHPSQHNSAVHCIASPRGGCAWCAVQVWSRLPRSCQAAWDRLLSRHASEAGEAGAAGVAVAVAGPALMQILDSFADDSGGWGVGVLLNFYVGCCILCVEAAPACDASWSYVYGTHLVCTELTAVPSTTLQRMRRRRRVAWIWLPWQLRGLPTPAAPPGMAQLCVTRRPPPRWA
jgi:hypothetical protein